MARRLVNAAQVVRTGALPPIGDRTDLQKGYLLIQEFLEGNTFDTRITVIGNRAFGFKRLNRPNDFRASGSGLLDWAPASIGEDGVALAFRVARALGAQSLAVDVLRRHGEPVINEISYYYEDGRWPHARDTGDWRKMPRTRGSSGWKGRSRPRKPFFPTSWSGSGQPRKPARAYFRVAR